MSDSPAVKAFEAFLSLEFDRLYLCVSDHLFMCGTHLHAQWDECPRKKEHEESFTLYQNELNRLAHG